MVRTRRRVALGLVLVMVYTVGGLREPDAAGW